MLDASLVGDPPVLTSVRGFKGKSSNSKKESEALAEGETELKFNISQNSKARIVFSGQVTQEAIELLAKMLDLQKLTFPKEVDLKLLPQDNGATPEEDID